MLCIQCRPPKSSLVKGEERDVALGEGREGRFVSPDVLHETVHEDDDGGWG